MCFWVYFLVFHATSLNMQFIGSFDWVCKKSLRSFPQIEFYFHLFIAKSGLFLLATHEALCLCCFWTHTQDLSFCEIWYIRWSFGTFSSRLPSHNLEEPIQPLLLQTEISFEQSLRLAKIHKRRWLWALLRGKIAKKSQL